MKYCIPIFLIIAFFSCAEDNPGKKGKDLWNFDSINRELKKLPEKI